MVTVGLDIGYGFTKAVSSEGVTMKFRTLVSRYIPQKVFSQNGKFIFVDNTRYLVGDTVSDNVLGNFSVTEDFVGTNEYYAIIGSILNQCPADVLILGLPPGLYTEDKVKQLKKKITIPVIKDEEGKLIQIPETVEYIPQGSGIYFSYISDGHEDELKDDIVVVDIGYYTVDVVLFSKGKFISDAARSYPYGNKFLFDKVKDHFSKVHSTFLSDESVESLISNGKIQHFGKEYYLDASPIVESYYQDQIMRAIKEYASFLKQNGRIVNKVIIGGGGIIWAGTIKGAVVVKNPQMANALGYMKYGLSKFRG